MRHFGELRRRGVPLLGGSVRGVVRRRLCAEHVAGGTARCPSQRTSCRSRHRRAGFRSPRQWCGAFLKGLSPQPKHDSPSTRHFASGCRAFTPVTCLPCACRSPLLRSFPVVSTPPKHIAAPGFGRWDGAQRSRSAPVARGPLRRLPPQRGRGPVASRRRTWGSLGFGWSVRGPLSEASERYSVPASARPFEGFLLVGSRTRSPGSSPSSPFVPQTAHFRVSPGPLRTQLSGDGVAPLHRVLGRDGMLDEAGSGISSLAHASGCADPAVRRGTACSCAGCFGSLTLTKGRRVSPGRWPPALSQRRIHSYERPVRRTSPRAA